MDFVRREETLLNVIHCVIKNAKSVLLTAIFAVILIYLFSICGYLFIQDDFVINYELPAAESNFKTIHKLILYICISKLYLSSNIIIIYTQIQKKSKLTKQQATNLLIWQQKSQLPNIVHSIVSRPKTCAHVPTRPSWATTTKQSPKAPNEDATRYSCAS